MLGSEPKKKSELTPSQKEIEQAGLDILNFQLNAERQKALDRVEHGEEAVAFAALRDNLEENFFNPLEQYKEVSFLNRTDQDDGKDIN